MSLRKSHVRLSVCILLLLAVTLVPLRMGFGPPGQARAAPASISGLHVQGNQIVNGSGRAIRLHGVNRSGTEYACIQGWGFFDGPSSGSSVQAIADWNANAVRIPMNEDCWLGINGAPSQYSGSNYQQAIADYVNVLNQHNIIPILELHWSAPGGQKATGQNPMPDQDHTVDFWRGVANKFKGNSSVIFDLFNEPYPDGNSSTTTAWHCWLTGECPNIGYDVAGMQQLVNTVRNTGADNIIMLGGVEYSNNISQWLRYKPNDPTGNLAASWHVYNFNICNTTSCWDSQAGPVAEAVPLIAGEIGENDCGSSFITNLMGWLEDHNQSYLAWTWDTWGTCLSLISNYDGTPKGVYGRAYRDHQLSLGSGPQPTNTPEPTNTPSPTNTPTPTKSPTSGGGSGQNYHLYRNGLMHGFTDHSFGYYSHNQCDRSTYAYAPCSYAIGYTQWGGINLWAPHHNFDVSPYTSLQWDLRPNRQSLSDFSVLLLNVNGQVIRQIRLQPKYVKKWLSSRWVRISVPLSQLDPSGDSIWGVQLKNYTGHNLRVVHIDNIMFVAK